MPGSLMAIDGVELISANTKAQARGGADVAVGDSALSQIDNPATLSLSSRDAWQLDFGSQLAISIASWNGPIDSDSDLRLIPVADLALAAPINDRLTLGVAFHSKAGLGTGYEMRHLLMPFGKRRVGSDMKCVELQLNMSLKLTDKLALGAGARAEVSTAEFSAVLGPADVEFGRGYAVGGGFQLGLHYQPRSDLALGLAYRSPGWFNDLSGGQGEASLLGLGSIPLGDVAIDEFRLPQRISAGVAWDATERLKLIGEVRWLNNKKSSLNSATIATSGLVDLRYPFPLGYRDQWVFVAGLEYELSDRWVLGAGYHYSTQAVDRENLSPIGSCIPQHHASIGLRYETEKWWAGASYTIAFSESSRGGGWSDIPLAFDNGLSEIEQTQHLVGFGFGFSL